MRWIYEKKKMICAAAAIVLAVLVTGVTAEKKGMLAQAKIASCLLYTSPSPRDA